MREHVGGLVVVALSLLALGLLGAPFPLVMSAGGLVLAATAALRDVANLPKGQNGQS